MKRLTCWRSAVLSIVTVLTLPVYAQAADYSFTTEAPDDYYPSTSYEDVHGARYNYGGNNVIDYQIPELEYSNTYRNRSGRYRWGRGYKCQY